MTLYPHHVQSFGRVNEYAMQYVEHSGTFSRRLRSQPTEKPIEPVTVGKLGAVRVVSLDYGSQKLVEVARDLIPGLATFVTGQSYQETLGRYNVYLVYGLENQV